MVSSLKHTDEKFAEDTAAATSQLQEGVDDFGAKIQGLQVIGQQVKEMREQNLLLQQRIEELLRTKEGLERALASITTVQTKSHENNEELAALASQLATSKADMATTEGHIRQELAAWKTWLTTQTKKEPPT
jgi:predicted RNase H-like nuclease (RuvC/YqgF family)